MTTGRFLRARAGSTRVRKRAQAVSGLRRWFLQRRGFHQAQGFGRVGIEFLAVGIHVHAGNRLAVLVAGRARTAAPPTCSRPDAPAPRRSYRRERAAGRSVPHFRAARSERRALLGCSVTATSAKTGEYVTQLSRFRRKEQQGGLGRSLWSAAIHRRFRPATIVRFRPERPSGSFPVLPIPHP